MWFSRYFTRERREGSSEYLALDGSPDVAAGDSPDDDEILATARKNSVVLSDWVQLSSYSLRAASHVLLLYILLALAACTIVGLSFVLLSRTNRLSRPSERQARSTQVLLRSTEDNQAGLGSVLQQLQRSIILSGLMGSELFSVESFSEHGYDTVGLINSVRNTVMGTVDLTRVCKLSRYMTQESYQHITDQACAAHLQGLNSTSLLVDWELAALKRMEGCSVVIQDQPWEWDPWLVKCTWKWVSRNFGHPLPRVVPNALSVGLHIRWGDMADSAPGAPGDPHGADRSIPIPTANAVVEGLTDCLGPLSLRVYMENHNDTILAGLHYPFELVDTENGDVPDLVDLTSNDVIVVAGSAYTVISHMMARGGLTLVPDFERHQGRYWEETGTNEVEHWMMVSNGTTRDCAAVRSAFEKGRAKGSLATLEFQQKTWKEIGLGRI